MRRGDARLSYELVGAEFVVDIVSEVAMTVKPHNQEWNYQRLNLGSRRVRAPISPTSIKRCYYIRWTRKTIKMMILGK